MGLPIKHRMFKNNIFLSIRRRNVSFDAAFTLIRIFSVKYQHGLLIIWFQYLREYNIIHAMLFRRCIRFMYFAWQNIEVEWRTFTKRDPLTNVFNVSLYWKSEFIKRIKDAKS